MKITEALVVEHTIFLSVFDQIERALPALTTLVEAQTMVTIVEGLLLTHGETEQNLAYLALDHMLADKGRLDRLYQEHQEIDEHLRQAHTALDLTEARRLLKAGLGIARRHFKYEERQVFPLLEKVLQHETLTDLGGVWLQRFAALQAVS
jgi:hemerythrin-like domain-containing protein